MILTYVKILQFHYGVTPIPFLVSRCLFAIQLVEELMLWVHIRQLGLAEVERRPAIWLQNCSSWWGTIFAQWICQQVKITLFEGVKSLIDIWGARHHCTIKTSICIQLLSSKFCFRTFRQHCMSFRITYKSDNVQATTLIVKMFKNDLCDGI